MGGGGAYFRRGRISGTLRYYRLALLPGFCMERRKESLMWTALGASSSLGNVHATLLPKLRPIANFQTPRNYEGIDNHM